MVQLPSTWTIFQFFRSLLFLFLFSSRLVVNAFLFTIDTHTHTTSGSAVFSSSFAQRKGRLFSITNLPNNVRKYPHDVHNAWNSMWCATHWQAGRQTGRQQLIQTHDNSCVTQYRRRQWENSHGLTCTHTLQNDAVFCCATHLSCSRIRRRIIIIRKTKKKKQVNLRHTQRQVNLWKLYNSFIECCCKTTN